MKSMKDQYGDEEGEKVFYASINKGTIKGVEEEVKGTASPAMQALMKRTAALKAKKERAALMAANKKRKDEAQSFSKTDTAAMKDAAKPLNPKPKKAKTPSLTAGGNTTAGANAAGDYGVPVGNDANKKSQELKQQNIKTRSMYEWNKERIDEVLPAIAMGLARAAGGAARVGSKVAGAAVKGGAKVAKKVATKKVAKKVAGLVRDRSKEQDMEDNTQYENSYVTTLLETRASKKTQAAADKAAKAKFEAGQRILRHKPGSYKPSKEALARQGMVPPKVGGRTRKGMRDHTGYRRIGSMLAEAMGLVEGRRAYKGHRDVAGMKLSKPTPKKKTPEEAAAAAAKGQAAHDARRAKFKAHVAQKNKEAQAERNK